MFHPQPLELFLSTLALRAGCADDRPAPLRRRRLGRRSAPRSRRRSSSAPSRSGPSASSCSRSRRRGRAAGATGAGSERRSALVGGRDRAAAVPWYVYQAVATRNPIFGRRRSRRRSWERWPVAFYVEPRPAGRDRRPTSRRPRRRASSRSCTPTPGATTSAIWSWGAAAARADPDVNRRLVAAERRRPAARPCSRWRAGSRCSRSRSRAGARRPSGSSSR